VRHHRPGSGRSQFRDLPHVAAAVEAALKRLEAKPE
jgi:hypothetical protein